MHFFTLPSGRKISSNDILELAKMEMDDCCHEDFIKDYETKLDFYLSNVTLDSYVNYYLPDYFEHEFDDDDKEHPDDFSYATYYHIRNLVIAKIKQLYEAGEYEEELEEEDDECLGT